MKYIVIETDDSHKAPILFPDYIEHVEVARNLTKGQSLISAGFCRVYANPTEEDPVDFVVSCYGTSYSLGISPKEGDDTLIKTELKRLD